MTESAAGRPLGRTRLEADRLRLAFGSWARDYHEHRPGYPEAALDHLAGLVEVAEPRCLDLGAGTGLLSEGLVRRGWRVVGVEPDRRMREVLGEVLGPGHAVDGSAEQLPFADASFDAVTAGQMWHWVDPALAEPEVARILRPGGILAILWVLRDDRVEWVRELAEALALPDTYVSSDEDRPVTLSDRFGPVSRAEFDFENVVNADELIAQLRTYAVVATRPDCDERLEEGRARLKADLEKTGSFAAPYVCKLFTAGRVSG